MAKKFVNLYLGFTAAGWLSESANRRKVLTALWEANEGRPVSCYRSSDVLREALPGATGKFISQITNRLWRNSYITGSHVTGGEKGRGRTGYWSLTSRGNKEVAEAEKVRVISSPPSPSGERRRGSTGQAKSPSRSNMNSGSVPTALAEKVINYIRSSQKLPTLRQEVNDLEKKLSALRSELAECERVVARGDELEKELTTAKPIPQSKN